MYFNEQDFDKFWQNYESRIAINNKRIVTLLSELRLCRFTATVDSYHILKEIKMNNQNGTSVVRLSKSICLPVILVSMILQSSGVT